MHEDCIMISRLTVLALMLCYCGTADAYGSLRCKGKLISPGITMAEVLSLCGPPTGRIAQEIPVRHRVGTGFSRFSGIILDEQWAYDRGWGKFPALLLFQYGKLKRVEYLRHRSGAR